MIHQKTRSSCIFPQHRHGQRRFSIRIWGIEVTHVRLRFQQFQPRSVTCMKSLVFEGHGGPRSEVSRSPSGSFSLQIRTTSEQRTKQCVGAARHRQGKRREHHRRFVPLGLIALPLPTVPADTRNLLATLCALGGHTTPRATLDAITTSCKATLSRLARHSHVPASNFAFEAHSLRTTWCPNLRVESQERQLQTHSSFHVLDQRRRTVDEAPGKRRSLSLTSML
mmetsp:Transcript_7521/g.20579  ORF Transcript_7521/g.20579 Transcript_7521/m.20579 type:complete len:224 (+) Transcript_7521:2052-2723(+)